MKYFTIKINSRLDKVYLIQALESLIYKGNNGFFIFPVCLFQKSYYKYLNEKRKAPYSGDVNDSNFKFSRTIYYGNVSSGMRSLLLTIEGEILENNGMCKLKTDFCMSKFNILLFILLIVGFTIAYIFSKNVLFIVLALMIAVDFFRITIINYLKIRKRILRNDNLNVP